jgi:hypothetical protein
MNCRVCKNQKPIHDFTRRYDKLTQTCIECSYNRTIKEHCFHDIRKHDCPDCINPIHRRALMMLKTKHKDKIKDKQNDLTYENVIELITNSNDLCAYCGIDLQHHSRNKPRYSSIERMDERVGHMIDNCLITCLDCNLNRVGKSIWSY